MTPISTLHSYDVCICGAGLAGLCLARQLKLEMPNLRVALVDKQARPLQAGTHKVGESSIEAGSHYLIHTLGLQEYLDRVHKYKCGLRFFTKSGQVPIDQRTEIGSPDFPLIPAMQLDRGVLENDLRQMCVDMGVELAEGVLVRDIRLANGDHHEVELQYEDGPVVTLRARWVIDAMGRRRFLAKKLGLTKDVTHKASACWWRIPGKWDITEAVPKSAADPDWYDRELGPRWYSTNHFMGYGYWVWVIPVASHTSIGIVSDETIHPLVERASIAKAHQWLEKYEPHLARWLQDTAPSDFLALKNFAHTSARFYSIDRWVCVGEAALFGDPYYSTGTDLIALQNNVITRMIRRDAKGELTASIVDNYNSLVAEFYRGVLAMYDGQYTIFENEYVHYHKTMWDYDYITGPMGKLGFAPHVLDDVEALPDITEMLGKWSDLNIRVQKLLRDWARLAPGKTIDRSDTAEVKIGKKGMLVPNMQVFQTFTDQLKMRTASGLVEACSGNLLEFAEGRAVWLFKKAIQDLEASTNGIPYALLEKVRQASWVNPKCIGLDASQWEASGLLRPTENRVIDRSQMDYLVPAVSDRENLVRNYARPDELIWRNITQLPNKVAVVCGEDRITYGELGMLAASARDYVKSACDKPKGVVAAVTEGTIDALAVFLGTLSADVPFVAVPWGAGAQTMLRDIGPAVTIVGPQDQITGGAGKIVKISDVLARRSTALADAGRPTLSSRLAKCYGRYQGSHYPRLRWITYYSLMNFYFYTELALRQRMALNSSEAGHPILVLYSTTMGGHDWLLPLVYGGTLIIRPRSDTNEDMFDKVERVASELGGQPVVSGTPEDLQRITEGVALRKGLMLLALDRGLTAAESGVLTKVAPAVVDSGVIVWGHEDLWPEKLRGAAAAETPLPPQLKASGA